MKLLEIWSAGLLIEKCSETVADREGEGGESVGNNNNSRIVKLVFAVSECCSHLALYDVWLTIDFMCWRKLGRRFEKL